MPRTFPPVDGKDATSRTLSPSLVESTAGFTAGVVATLAVHPFDVLKTRLQLDTRRGQWGSSAKILQDIVRTEGGYSALYRGLMPNMIGNSVSWSLYFLWYGNLKDGIQAYRGLDSHLTPADYFVASGVSGILTSICTNPIWVIKTRMLQTGRNSPHAYHSTAHGIRSIFATEGLKGFWRGLVPSLFGNSHGAVQFAAYEQLKNHRRNAKAKLLGAPARKAGEEVELSNWDYLLLSGSSKIFAGSITYPYQVVRARLQTYEAGKVYKGAWDAVVQIWRKEALRGFYKGLLPNIIRVLPSTCVTFLVYENTKWYLPRLYDAETAHETE